MLLNISPHSALTLQEQIIGQIRAQILTGELLPDAPLPSIRALSQELRVGINTVQRAYEQLLREELVYARPAKGFFVAPLNDADKSDRAAERFASRLHALIGEGRQEGLSDRSLKQIFTRLLKEMNKSGVTHVDA